MTITRTYPTAATVTINDPREVSVYPETNPRQVVFSWDTLDDLFSVSSVINPDLEESNQVVTSEGARIVWCARPIVAVTITVPIRTARQTLGNQTFKGCLIDRSGLISRADSSQRTLVLLVADYISDPTIYATETTKRLAL